MVFVFDDCELDLDTLQLRVGGQPRSVEPQVFDVLAHLVRHRDRVVSKDELLDEVWHHRFVTESAISSRIKSARRAIDDDGRAQRLIRTAHGRGYQFVGIAQVAGRAYEVSDDSCCATGSGSAPATSSPRRAKSMPSRHGMRRAATSSAAKKGYTISSDPGIRPRPGRRQGGGQGRRASAPRRRSTR